MESKTKRYIIITTPPEPISRELTVLINKLAAIGNTITAKQYPPHITLRTGVNIPEHKRDFFFQDFKKVTDELPAFSVKTQGIDIISYIDNGKTRYLIYYKIEKSREILYTNKKLLSYSLFKKSNKTRFHPHMSLAYNDIDKTGLSRIKSYLKNNNYRKDFCWLCDNVGFYYEENGKWLPYHIFTLKRNN